MITDGIRIILGSLKYKSAPNVDFSLKVPLIQTTKEIIEFDRTIDVELEQVFYNERQKSTTFRPSCKYQLIFENGLSGQTNYPPFENNLYYLDAEATAALQCSVGATNIAWKGLPQYNEFDFIRNDYNIPGYTQPPNEHRFFQPESASTYNWNFFISYAFSSTTAQTMSVIFKDDPSNQFTWICGDGIPFIIQRNVINGSNLISFKCPMKHGLSVGEYVQLSLSYNSQNLFEVYSLGLEEYGNEEYVFNLYDIGYTGTTFNNQTSGTFKRVINPDNISDTISKYYIRKNKILTDVNDAVLVKAGFDQNAFGIKKKYESSGFTPNQQARVSIKEGSQSYTLSFNTDVDISPLRDNELRPVTELFFSAVWKGYFGWMFGVSNGSGSYLGLQQGWEFNLPLDPAASVKSPNPWWDNSNPLSFTSFPVGTYTNLPQGTTLAGQTINFTYIQDLKSGDIIDGDYCEWNDFEQNERVISHINHKFKFNPSVFFSSAPNSTNIFGYYYQAHHPITLRVYSDYIESGDPAQVVGIPDYAHYTTTNNQFIWRDIYDYGFIDNQGRGVSYPFLNGKHYPFRDVVFRIIPEGTNYSEQNIIFTPIIDYCE